jgi:uncharacterized protein YbaP (TraB family)
MLLFAEMLAEPKTKAKQSPTRPRCNAYSRLRMPIILIGVMLAAGWVRAVSPDAQEAAPQKACLWRVQSSNTTAYLQGSIHLLSEASYPLPRQIEAAFAASDQLVMEVDLAIMTNPKAQLEMVLQGMLSDGRTLDSILSAKTLALAKTSTEAMGLQLGAFRHYKPWMFVMTLTATRLQQLGFSAENGLDWHFYKRAVAQKKNVIGLETVNEQLMLLDAMAGDDQDAFVRQSLEEFADIKTEMTAMIAAWSMGDIEALGQALLKNLRKYPNVYSSLIRDRNLKWMKQFNEVMQSGVTSMIVVGAGHIPGPDGLIVLLRAQGYTVEQL